MKNIQSITLWGLFLIIFTNCGKNTNQQKYPFIDEWGIQTEMDLKGNIKSIEMQYYQAIEKFGKVEKSDPQQKYEFQFDENCHISECVYYNRNGLPDFRYTYQYNEKGQITEKNCYNTDGSLYSKDIYLYNEQNLLTMRDCYIHGYLSERHEYGYEGNGNFTVSRYNGDGETISKYYYECNPDNNKEYLRYNINSKGELDPRQKLLFDEQGHMIESQNVFNDYNVTYAYQYDETGNWIMKVKFTDQEPKEIIERIIKYQ